MNKQNEPVPAQDEQPFTFVCLLDGRVQRQGSEEYCRQWADAWNGEPVRFEDAGCATVEPLYRRPAQAEQDDLLDEQRGQAALYAVIDYMLSAGRHEEPMEFLRCWNEGNFDALREEWPEAPLAIYYADPLADHAAIDAALSAQGGK